MDPTLSRLQLAGFVCKESIEDSRRLEFMCEDGETKFLIVRASDVPTYVEYGAADAGVVGKDVLLEQDRDVYEPLDLKFGGCRIAVAVLKGREASNRFSSKIRVATKYPRITERHFNRQGLLVEIIKLYGSIELAPMVGLADRIVDLVSTGKTLKENNLVEIDVIAQSTARLIVNRASLKLKHTLVTNLIDQLAKASVPLGAQLGKQKGPRPSTLPHRKGRSAKVKRST